MRRIAKLTLMISAEQVTSDPTSEVIEAVFELDYFASKKVQGKREQSELDLLRNDLKTLFEITLLSDQSEIK